MPMASIVVPIAPAPSLAGRGIDARSPPALGWRVARHLDPRIETPFLACNMAP
jgi:hypothetical protein